jgi:polygalacturonase
MRLGLLWALAAAAGLHAQDTRQVSEPVFPPVCATLLAQLTATPNGMSLPSETVTDTASVQSALNACPAGQAVELASAGPFNAFLIAPITLPARVTLLVKAGVTVFASRNPRDYDAIPGQCGTLTPSSGGCKAFITASRADGAGIMGYGTIDGRGELPMMPGGAAGSISWWDLANQANVTGSTVTQNNPRMLQISNTSGFTLYKITLKNSPNFHVAMGTSSNVTVWGIKIITPYDARNTDGVDPGYSNNVTIANSYISDGDDNVAIGGNNPPGATNISVIDNHFGDGHGASIGSYTSNGVSNVLFDHLSFAGTKANSNANGIRIKSDSSRGGLVRNITYSNICMQDVRAAIVLDPYYSSSTGTLIPHYENIRLVNIHAVTEGTVKIQGHDATVPTTITLDNVQIDNIKSSDLSQQYVSYTLGPNPVNFASMLKGAGVTVQDNVTRQAGPYACPASIFAPVAGELIPNTRSLSAGRTLTIQAQVFTTKTVPYQTYLLNLKTNPNTTLSIPAPTGTVTVYDGAVPLGTAQLDGSALVNIHLPALPVGVHTLTAAYSGDATYPAFTFGNYRLAVRRAARARRAPKQNPNP